MPPPCDVVETPLPQKTNVQSVVVLPVLREEDKHQQSQHQQFPTSPPSNSSARDLLWQQWVPLDASLYHWLQHAQLAMLQYVDQVLTNAKIPYWICGGTLLGAIRHGGFIPHDDDVDVEIYSDDLAKLAEFPYDNVYTRFCERSGSWQGHAVARMEFWGGVLAVDVFPRPSPLPLPANNDSPNFPSQTEVVPFSRYRFHNIAVWGPNRDKCESYLDRLYGNDWRETVCVWNHDFNWCHSAEFEPRRQTLPLDDYNAIVQAAGYVPPQAQRTAQETWQDVWDKNIISVGHDTTTTRLEQYQAYQLQRTIRRNRAHVEWRERRKQEQILPTRQESKG